MKSILQDIKQIRNNASFNIIQPLSNRYAVLCQEADTSKTAYCFSVPIRSIDTNDIIKPYFQHYKSESLFNGSSAKITIIDKVRFTSPDGECDLVFEGNLYKKTTDAIFYKNHCNVIEIRPTLNGLMVMTDYNATNAQIPLSLHLHKPFEAIRTNGKYFSVMKSKFIPFITVSCIGVMDDEERVIAPCELHYQEKSSLEYTLTFSSIYKSKARIAFEINMQETKLFQDTTVESKHPKQNNAFGGTAFLGTSQEYGMQWLYTRLETSNLSFLQGKTIQKANFHIPQLSNSVASLSANQISARFCSFGSNWKNKISASDLVAQSFFSNGYHHFDITQLIRNVTGAAPNLIIRNVSTAEPVAIPTGDSFNTPQILEITYQ